MTHVIDRRRFLIGVGSASVVAGCQVSGDGQAPNDTGEPEAPDSSTSPGSLVESPPRDGIRIYRSGTVGDRETWDGIRTGFEERTGTSASVIVQNYGFDERRLTGDDLPDIANPGGSLGELFERGIVSDLGGELDRIVQSYGPLVTESDVTVDGHVPMIPHGVLLGGILNYRVDVYEELGLSVPETWADLVENARRIDESDAVEARGFAVSTSADKGFWDFTTALYNAGGRYWRWRGASRDELEVAFEPGDVREALDLLDTLGQYSGPSTDLGFGDVMSGWLTGEYAQCVFPNASLSSRSYENGAGDSIAGETEQSLFPQRDRSVTSFSRGPVWYTGWSVLDGDGVGKPATRFLQYLYGDSEAYADLLRRTDPMWYVPPFREIIERDAYSQASVFESGDSLQRQKRCVTDFAPKMAGERFLSGPALVADRRDVVHDLLEAVLVEGKPKDEEVDRARRRLRSELETGRGAVYDN